MKHLTRSLIALVLVSLFAGPAPGADANWTGGGATADWFDADNWSAATAPGTGETATFDVDSWTVAQPLPDLGGGSAAVDVLEFVGAATGYIIENGGMTIGSTLRQDTADANAVNYITADLSADPAAMGIALDIASGVLVLSGDNAGLDYDSAATVSAAGELWLESVTAAGDALIELDGGKLGLDVGLAGGTGFGNDVWAIGDGAGIEVAGDGVAELGELYVDYGATVTGSVRAGLLNVGAGGSLAVSGNLAATGSAAVGAGAALSANSLDVASTLTLNAGAVASFDAASAAGSLVLADGSRLDANADLAVVAATGNSLTFAAAGARAAVNVLDAGATVTVGKVSAPAQAVTLVKAGAGTLRLAEPNNVLAGSTIEVGAGRVELYADEAGSSADTAAITLAGGTLAVQSPSDLAAGLDARYYDASLTASSGRAAEFRSLQAVRDFEAAREPNAAGTLVSLLDSPGSADGDNPLRGLTHAEPIDPVNVGNDNVVAVWEGFLHLDEDGLREFSTQSDDGTVVFIDGRLVVDNNYYQGYDGSRRSGSADLSAGWHEVLLGYYEGTGGAGFTFLDGDGQVLDAADFFHGTQTLRASVASDVTVTASSAIHTTAAVSTDFGSLTMARGTVLTAVGSAAFASTALTGGAGAATFDVAADATLSLGPLADGGTATVVDKVGGGTLSIAPTGPAALSASSFRVAAGTLAASADHDAKTSLGGRPVTLDGGTLALEATNGLPGGADAIARWSFDEGAGSVASDSVGTNLASFVGGSPTWTARGRHGGAVDLDGDDDAFIAGAIDQLDGGSFTISFWANRDVAGEEDWVFAQGTDDNPNKHLHVGFRSSDEFALGFWSDDLNASPPAVPSDDTTGWHLWTVSFDADSNTQAIYADGAPVATRTADGPLELAGATEFVMGRRRNSGSNNYDGLLDEVTVWGTALSPNDVADVYAFDPALFVQDYASDVTILADSAIDVDGAVALGTATHHHGATLGVAGEGALLLDGLAIEPNGAAASAVAYDVAAGATLYAGAYAEDGNGTTIEKGGDGAMLFDTLAAPAANTAVNVRGGTVGVLTDNAADADRSALDGAMLHLDGGTLAAYGTAGEANAVTFDDLVTVGSGGGTFLAGPVGRHAADGPLTVVRPDDASGAAFAVPAGAELALGAAGGYELHVTGTLGGEGNTTTEGDGTVLLDDVSATGALTAAGPGLLRVDGMLDTPSALAVTGGTMEANAPILFAGPLTVGPDGTFLAREDVSLMSATLSGSATFDANVSIGGDFTVADGATTTNGPLFAGGLSVAGGTLTTEAPVALGGDAAVDGGALLLGDSLDTGGGELRITGRGGAVRADDANSLALLTTVIVGDGATSSALAVATPQAALPTDLTVRSWSLLSGRMDGADYAPATRNVTFEPGAVFHAATGPEPNTVELDAMPGAPRLVAPLAGGPLGDWALGDDANAATTDDIYAAAAFGPWTTAALAGRLTDVGSGGLTVHMNGTDATVDGATLLSDANAIRFLGTGRLDWAGQDAASTVTGVSRIAEPGSENATWFDLPPAARWDANMTLHLEHTRFDVDAADQIAGRVEVADGASLALDDHAPTTGTFVLGDGGLVKSDAPGRLGGGAEFAFDPAGQGGSVLVWSQYQDYTTDPAETGRFYLDPNANMIVHLRENWWLRIGDANSDTDLVLGDGRALVTTRGWAGNGISDARAKNIRAAAGASSVIFGAAPNKTMNVEPNMLLPGVDLQVGDGKDWSLPNHESDLARADVPLSGTVRARGSVIAGDVHVYSGTLAFDNSRNGGAVAIDDLIGHAGGTVRFERADAFNDANTRSIGGSILWRGDELWIDLDSPFADALAADPAAEPNAGFADEIVLGGGGWLSLEFPERLTGTLPWNGDDAFVVRQPIRLEADDPAGNRDYSLHLDVNGPGGAVYRNTHFENVALDAGAVLSVYEEDAVSSFDLLLGGDATTSRRTSGVGEGDDFDVATVRSSGGPRVWTVGEAGEGHLTHLLHGPVDHAAGQITLNLVNGTVRVPADGNVPDTTPIVLSGGSVYRQDVLNNAGGENGPFHTFDNPVRVLPAQTGELFFWADNTRGDPWAVVHATNVSLGEAAVYRPREFAAEHVVDLALDGNAVLNPAGTSDDGYYLHDVTGTGGTLTIDAQHDNDMRAFGAVTDTTLRWASDATLYLTDAAKPNTIPLIPGAAAEYGFGAFSIAGGGLIVDGGGRIVSEIDADLDLATLELIDGSLALRPGQAVRAAAARFDVDTDLTATPFTLTGPGAVNAEVTVAAGGGAADWHVGPAGVLNVSGAAAADANSFVLDGGRVSLRLDGDAQVGPPAPVTATGDAPVLDIDRLTPYGLADRTLSFGRLTVGDGDGDANLTIAAGHAYNAAFASTRLRAGDSNTVLLDAAGIGSTVRTGPVSFDATPTGQRLDILNADGGRVALGALTGGADDTIVFRSASGGTLSLGASAPGAWGGEVYVEAGGLTLDANLTGYDRGANGPSVFVSDTIDIAYAGPADYSGFAGFNVRLSGRMEGIVGPAGYDLFDYAIPGELILDTDRVDANFVQADGAGSTRAVRMGYGSAVRSVVAGADYRAKLDTSGLTYLGDVLGEGADFTLSGELLGGGSLVKVGSEAVTLSGPTAWGGDVDVEAGSLVIGRTAAAPGAPESVVIDRGALYSVGEPNWAYDEVDMTASEGVLALSRDSDANYAFDSATLSLGARADSTYGGTLTPGPEGFVFGGGGATLTLDTPLAAGEEVRFGWQSGGAGDQSPLAPGKVVLARNTAVDANVAVNMSIRYGSGDANGPFQAVDPAAGKYVTVNEGGAIDLADAWNALENIVTNGGGVSNVGGHLSSFHLDNLFPNVPDSDYVLGSDFVDGTGNTDVLPGSMTNAASGLVKVGENTVTLQGAQGYGGEETSVRAGVLNVAAPNSLGATTDLHVHEGARIRFASGGAFAASLSLAGTLATDKDLSVHGGGGVSLDGAPRVDVAADKTLTFGRTTGPAGVTLVKAGPGSLSLEDTSNALAGAVRVEDGTVSVFGDGTGSSLDAAAVELDGGRLLVNPASQFDPGLIGEYFSAHPTGDPAGPGVLEYLDAAAMRAYQASHAGQVETMTGPLDSPGGRADDGNPLRALQHAGGVTVDKGTNDVMAFWDGYIEIDTPGEYTFYTSSDDGTMLYIDDELVVDNNRLQGYSNSERSGTFTFDEPGRYPLYAGYYESGGGAGFTFSWESAAAGIGKAVIPGGQFFHGGYAPVVAIDAPVTVTAETEIETARAATARFGALSLARGVTLTLDGSSSFAATDLTGGAGAVTIDTPRSASVSSLGPVADGAVASTVVKTGPGELKLAPTPAASLTATDFRVLEGTLTAAEADGQTSLDGRPVELAGGTLRLIGSFALPKHGNVLHEWQFDEGEGTEAYDGFGNNTAVFHAGTPNWTENGRFGGAVDYSGSGDWFNAEAIEELHDASFSISFWAKRDVAGSEDWVLGQQEGNSTRRHLHVGFRGNDEFAFGFYGDDVNVPGDSVPSTDTENWHMWTVTYDKATGRQAVYVDGSFVRDDNAGPLDVDGAGAFRIGRRGDTGDFDGLLDQVMVWSDTLDANDVADLVNWAPGSDYTDFAGDLAVTADSRLDAVNSVALGGVTHRAGTTLSVTGEGAAFLDSLTVAPTAPGGSTLTYDVAAGTALHAGAYTEDANGTSLVKTGDGMLLFHEVDVAPADGATTVAVRGGQVGVLGDGIDPDATGLRGAAVEIDGGALVISAANGDANGVRFDNPVEITPAGGSFEARAVGPGAATHGDVLVTRPTGLTVPDAATLTFVARGNHRLAVAGPVDGNGSVAMSGDSTVTLADVAYRGTTTVDGPGTLRVTDDLDDTAAVAVHAGGLAVEATLVTGALTVDAAGSLDVTGTTDAGAATFRGTVDLHDTATVATATDVLGGTTTVARLDANALMIAAGKLAVGDLVSADAFELSARGVLVSNDADALSGLGDFTVSADGGGAWLELGVAQAHLPRITVEAGAALTGATDGLVLRGASAADADTDIVLHDGAILLATAEPNAAEMPGERIMRPIFGGGLDADDMPLGAGIVRGAAYGVWSRADHDDPTTVRFLEDTLVDAAGTGLEIDVNGERVPLNADANFAADTVRLFGAGTVSLIGSPSGTWTTLTREGNAGALTGRVLTIGYHGLDAGRTVRVLSGQAGFSHQQALADGATLRIGPDAVLIAGDDNDRAQRGTIVVEDGGAVFANSGNRLNNGATWTFEPNSTLIFRHDNIDPTGNWPIGVGGVRFVQDIEWADKFNGAGLRLADGDWLLTRSGNYGRINEGVGIRAWQDAGEGDTVAIAAAEGTHWQLSDPVDLTVDPDAAPGSGDEHALNLRIGSDQPMRTFVGNQDLTPVVTPMTGEVRVHDQLIAGEVEIDGGTLRADFNTGSGTWATGTITVRDGGLLDAWSTLHGTAWDADANDFVIDGNLVLADGGRAKFNDRPIFYRRMLDPDERLVGSVMVGDRSTYYVQLAHNSNTVNGTLPIGGTDANCSVVYTPITFAGRPMDPNIAAGDDWRNLSLHIRGGGNDRVYLPNVTLEQADPCVPVVVSVGSSQLGNLGAGDANSVRTGIYADLTLRSDATLTKRTDSAYSDRWAVVDVTAEGDRTLTVGEPGQDPLALNAWGDLGGAGGDLTVELAGGTLYLQDAATVAPNTAFVLSGGELWHDADRGFATPLTVTGAGVVRGGKAAGGGAVAFPQLRLAPGDAGLTVAGTGGYTATFAGTVVEPGGSGSIATGGAGTAAELADVSVAAGETLTLAPGPGGTILADDLAGAADSGLAVDGEYGTVRVTGDGSAFAGDLDVSAGTLELSPDPAGAGFAWGGGSDSVRNEGTIRAAAGVTDLRGVVIDSSPAELATARPPRWQDVLAYWKFDTGAGGTALDEKGTHDGTLENGPAWTEEGKFGRALDFAGNTGRVTNADLDVADRSFSLSAWVKRADGSRSIVFSQGDSGNAHKAMHIGFKEADTALFNFYTDDMEVDEAGGQDFDDGQWHLLTGVYDDANKARYMYFDGQEITRKIGGNIQGFSGSGPFTIGEQAYGLGGQGDFNGLIDDAIVWGSILTAEEVLDLYLNWDGAGDVITGHLDVAAGATMKLGGFTDAGDVTIDGAMELGDTDSDCYSLAMDAETASLLLGDMRLRVHDGDADTLAMVWREIAEGGDANGITTTAALGEDLILGAQLDDEGVILGVTLRADLNLDGVVDGADLAFLDYEADPAWYNGDITLDGTVDYLDYIACKRAIGSEHNPAVPEPGTLLLLLAGGAAGVVCRRRRYRA